MQQPVWTVENTQKLFRLASEANRNGKPLAGVYRAMAKELGLSEGSVRNYYYAHMHTFAMLPEVRESMGITLTRAGREYTPFEDGEAEELVRTVLIRRAEGVSVRAIVDDLAGGDPKLALRYQNKYRSVVFRQRARTEKIIRRLIEQKVTFFHPYENAICKNGECAPTGGLKDAVKGLEKALGRESAYLLLTALSRLVGKESKEEKLEDLRAFVRDAERTETSIGQ